MKIKKILIESFKSPFLNLLAIANLSLVTLAGSFELFRTTPFIELIRYVNIPALMASFILTRSIYSFALVPPLIYLQWIFIGALAKLIASHIKLKTD